jgi:hypothetical protein
MSTGLRYEIPKDVQLLLPGAKSGVDSVEVDFEFATRATSSDRGLRHDATLPVLNAICLLFCSLKMISLTNIARFLVGSKPVKMYHSDPCDGLRAR